MRFKSETGTFYKESSSQNNFTYLNYIHVLCFIREIISPLHFFAILIFSKSVILLILGPYIGEEERIRHDALFYSQNPEDGLLLSGKELQSPFQT